MALHEENRQIDYDEGFERLVEAQRQGNLLAMRDIDRARKAQQDRQRFYDKLPANIFFVVVVIPLLGMFGYQILVPMLWNDFTSYLFGG